MLKILEQLNQDNLLIEMEKELMILMLMTNHEREHKLKKELLVMKLKDQVLELELLLKNQNQQINLIELKKDHQIQNKCKTNFSKKKKSWITKKMIEMIMGLKDRLKN